MITPREEIGYNFMPLSVFWREVFIVIIKEVKIMPSEKTLNAKKQLVADLNALIMSSSSGVLVDYQGINVENDTKLRSELREAGIKYSVVKNTMLNLALKDTPYESLCEHLHNSTALATAEGDAIEISKILQKYSDDSKGAFGIKGGFMEGKAVDSGTVAQMAKMPGREQLLGMLCSALSGNVRGLAVALSRIAETKEEQSA